MVIKEPREPVRVMLGLDEDNLDRMRLGQAVSVNLSRLDPDRGADPEMPDVELVMFFANQVESAMIRDRYRIDS